MASRVREAARAHRLAPLADDSFVLPVAAAAVPDRGEARSAIQDHRRLRALAALLAVVRRLDRQRDARRAATRTSARVGNSRGTHRLSLSHSRDSLLTRRSPR